MTKFKLPKKIACSPKLKLNIVLNVRNDHKGRELTSGGKATPLKSLGELNIVLGLWHRWWWWLVMVSELAVNKNKSTRTWVASQEALNLSSIA